EHLLREDERGDFYLRVEQLLGGRGRLWWHRWLELGPGGKRRGHWLQRIYAADQLAHSPCTTEQGRAISRAALSVLPLGNAGLPRPVRGVRAFKGARKDEIPRRINGYRVRGADRAGKGAGHQADLPDRAGK